MAKDNLTFRVSPELRAALEKASADDTRSLSSMIEKLLTDAMTAKGYLPR